MAMWTAPEVFSMYSAVLVEEQVENHKRRRIAKRKDRKSSPKCSNALCAVNLRNHFSAGEVLDLGCICHTSYFYQIEWKREE